jgi:phosphomannomutase
LLHALLGVAKVAVIAGGDWPQFEKQLLSNLPNDERLANLSRLPTCGKKFFKYTGDRRLEKTLFRRFYGGRKTKNNQFAKESGRGSRLPGRKGMGRSHWRPGKPDYVFRIGLAGPLEEKERWDPDYAKRKKIKAILDTLISEFSVRMGGATSIDVTKTGIDKAYGIKKLRDLLGISLKEYKADYGQQQTAVECAL